jgi:hypothetical protein
MKTLFLFSCLVLALPALGEDKTIAMAERLVQKNRITEAVDVYKRAIKKAISGQNTIDVYWYSWQLAKMRQSSLSGEQRLALYDQAFNARRKKLENASPA